MLSLFYWRSNQAPSRLKPDCSETGNCPVLTACSSGSETVAELTDDELVDRHWLELRVERAFMMRDALRELRDRRLYRDTHPDDFIGYCRDRFDKTKQAVIT
jgi:hypothetical protein